VTDYTGRPFPGLRKSHFKLLCDGREQRISHFSEDDAPVSVGLILDRSGSMGWKIDDAKEIVRSFEAQANPQDEIFLVTFAGTIDATDFTSVTADIYNRLPFVGSEGRTSLLDAVYLSISRMRDAKYQRRALVVVSDGGDNHSRYTQGEVERAVEESDTQLFAVALVDPRCMGFRDDCPQEVKLGPGLLEGLARKGGGIGYLIDSPRDIGPTVKSIGRILRQEYVLGFAPGLPKNTGPKYHKVRVKLQHLPKGLPPLRVDAKGGFYTTE
jgi:Ca-activated chloride channel family protein